MKKSLIYAMCLLIMALMSFSTSTAQTRKGTLTANSTTAEINRYFSDNILLLDPIEGVYSVDVTCQAWNNYGALPEKKYNYHMLILKRGNGYYTNIGKETTLKIRRIGETNVYDLEEHIEGPPAVGKFWTSTRVVLENGFFINYHFEFPGARTTCNYVKEYPTASMYEDALAAEVKRRQEEIEEQEKVTDWSGSGFALNNGYLCTNYHVVDEAKTIRIFGVQGDFTTSYSAKVIASDKVNDLAILKVDDANFSGFGAIPYNVKTTMDEVGEDIFVLGYPLTATMGDEVKLTTGVISSRTGYQGDVSLYQISAPVQPGNSGGPLFDSKGDLVGIVSARHTGAENVGYAVKASYLRNLMESSLSEDILPKNNTISSQPLTGKVSKVKNFVYYIVCSSQEGQIAPIPTNTIESQGEAEDNPKPYEEYEVPEGTSIHIDVIDPHVDYSPNGLTIKRVRVTDTQTIVDMECDTAYYERVGINPKTIIRCDGITYPLIDAINISKTPEYHHSLEPKVKLLPVRQSSVQPKEKLSFTLIFLAIQKEADEFDIIESGEENSFKFYGISLNSSADQSDKTVESSSYVEKEIANVTLDVKNPYIKTSSKGMTIKRVRKTDTRTYIDIELDNSICGYENESVSISPKTFLRDNKFIEYPLINVAGIPTAPQWYDISDKNQKLQFTLIFPDIPKDVTQLNLIENVVSGWFFLGIDLNPNVEQSDSDENQITYSEGTDGSRTIINVKNPHVKVLPRGITITGVKLTETQTIVDMKVNRVDSNFASVGISPRTIIIFDDGEAYLEAYPITDAINIPMTKKPSEYYFFRKRKETRLFTLVFPAIPLGTTEFHIYEVDGINPWRFHTISLK